MMAKKKIEVKDFSPPPEMYVIDSSTEFSTGFGKMTFPVWLKKSAKQIPEFANSVVVLRKNSNDNFEFKKDKWSMEFAPEFLGLPEDTDIETIKIDCLDILSAHSVKCNFKNIAKIVTKARPAWQFNGFWTNQEKKFACRGTLKSSFVAVPDYNGWEGHQAALEKMFNCTEGDKITAMQIGTPMRAFSSASDPREEQHVLFSDGHMTGLKYYKFITSNFPTAEFYFNVSIRAMVNNRVVAITTILPGKWIMDEKKPITILKGE